LKVQLASSVATVLLLASTAHAQRFSEVRFGENFDLDAYVSEVREPGPQAPGLQWNGNPNVRQTSTAPACYFVPGRVNVQKGEGVLSAERGSLIYELLASLGQQHSHSGMARDSQRIRHNTMATWAIRKSEDWAGVPAKLVGTGTDSLREGYPGTITHSVEAAVSHNEFNFADGLVLSAGSGPIFGLSQLLELSDADAEMADFRGHYRLFAYTDMLWRDPYARSSDDGNMCSGSIFHAHTRAGNGGWTKAQIRKYSTEVRQPAAALLYSQLRHKIIEDTSWLKEFGLTLYSLNSGSGLSTLAMRISNQVVNCMAFNDCNNTTPRWQAGVGSGASVSPDDLYNLALVNAVNAHLANKTNTFVYRTAKPLEKTGDYLCCERKTMETSEPFPTQPGTALPYTYTQCLRQY